MSANAYTDEDWAGLRRHITRLYYDEAKPLAEVIETMQRRYCFSATSYRLQKWGLDKKLREKEVVQMFLLKQQRDAAGKQSAFLVRGRPVDWEQVQR
ncbi:hypothetical protein BKA56DRAFT_488235, partial [Ilyonectria sp. MPI-CAGE-AT-0026]